MYLFNTKKMKIQEDIEIVNKFKTVFKEMNSDEYNLNKILEFDNDKMALLIKSLMNGNINNILNNTNNNGIFKFINKFSSSQKIKEEIFLFN